MAKITKNKKLFKEAKRYLVGGVDSPVRSFNYVGTDPILINKGKGAKVYDYDGKEYIDYVLSWGSAILGHAHPKVIADVKKAAGSGLSFGTTNKPEVELARAISEAIPFVEKIRFVNSGTEAVMGAVRLVRGYTDRDKILKFENSYHGHADHLLAKAGSGLATLNIPSSKGVPKEFVKNTLIAPLDDRERIEAIFKRCGRDIAAVIVEPVGGNYGVVPPEIGQLKFLRRISKKYGSLLIFDEVITGFRFNYGSFAQQAGIVPDIICLGKIIGGGLPIGAYAGKAKIMDNLAPLGQVYQASTFSGNPVTMRSGLSTLNILKNAKKKYADVKNLAKYLIINIWRQAGKHNVALRINSYESIFSLKFDKKEEFRIFYKLMLGKGVYLAPSEFEANFISFAHTKKDMDHTIKAVNAALGRIRK
ncbi:MAG: glutamate-1-semialdehyde 2,1-aminomutase [Candidatus Omnitrophota bacterium]|nr:glutamate-1-semialdehyde 2,1-aminomutase [Candidatus Omnitrophota bacterium]